MAWLNNTAATVTITIDGEDYSSELVSGTITDSSAINAGAVLSGGTFTFADQPGQSKLEDYKQNKFGRGKVVLIDVTIAGVTGRHPRGYMYVLGSTYNMENRQLTLEVGCILTLHNLTGEIGDMADLTIFPLTSNDEEIPTFANLLTAIDTEGKFLWMDNQGQIKKEEFFDGDGMGSGKAEAAWVGVRDYTCLSVAPLGDSATVPDTIKVTYQWQVESDTDTGTDPVTGKPQEEDETISTYWLEHPANMRVKQKVCTTDPQGNRTCKDITVNTAKRQYSVTKTTRSIRRYGATGGSVSTENEITTGPAVEVNGAYFAELYSFQLAQRYGDATGLKPDGLYQIIQSSREKTYEYGPGGEVIKSVEKTYKNYVSAMTQNDWRAGNAETGKVYEPDKPITGATRGFLTTIPSGQLYLATKVTTEYTYYDDRTVELTTTIQSSADCNGVGIYPPTGDRQIQNIGAENNGVKTTVKRTSTGGLLNPDQPPRNPGGKAMTTKSDVYTDESAKYFPTDAGSVTLATQVPFSVPGESEQEMRRIAANYAKVLRAQLEGDAAGIRVAETLRPEVLLNYTPGMPFSFYDHQEQKLVKLRMNSTGWAFAPGQTIFSTEGCFIGISNGTVTIPDNVDPVDLAEVGKQYQEAKEAQEAAQAEKDQAQAIKDQAQAELDQAQTDRDDAETARDDAQLTKTNAETYKAVTEGKLVEAQADYDAAVAVKDQAQTAYDQAANDRDVICAADPDSVECTAAKDDVSEKMLELGQATQDAEDAQTDLDQAQFDDDRAANDLLQAEEALLAAEDDLATAEGALGDAQGDLEDSQTLLDEKQDVLDEKDAALDQAGQDLADAAEGHYEPPTVEDETTIDTGKEGPDIVEVISVELTIGVGPNATGNGNDGIGVIQDWSVPLELRYNTNNLVFVSGVKVDKTTEILEIDSNGSLPEGADGSLLAGTEGIIIPDLFDPNVERNPDDVFEVVVAAAPPARTMRVKVGPEPPDQIFEVNTSAEPADQIFTVTAIATYNVSVAELPFEVIVGPEPPDGIFEVTTMATPPDQIFEVTRGPSDPYQTYEVLAGKTYNVITSFGIPEKIFKVSTGPQPAPTPDTIFGVSVGGLDAPPIPDPDEVYVVTTGIAIPDRTFRVDARTTFEVEVFEKPFYVEVLAEPADQTFEVEVLAQAFDQVFEVTTMAVPADKIFDVTIVNEFEVAVYERPVFYNLQEAQPTPGDYNYVVSGNGLNFSNSPTLDLNVGQMLRFQVDTPANTVWIKKEQEDGPGELDPYWGDLVNQGINSGFLYFRPWEPGTFFYQSEFDENVFGQINVIGAGAAEPDQILDVMVGADPDGYEMKFDVIVGPESPFKTFVVSADGGAPPANETFEVRAWAEVADQVFEVDSAATPITFLVQNFGDIAYQFSGGDLEVAEVQNNYTVNVEVGQMLEFNMQAPGYPLWIDSAPKTGQGDLNPAFADYITNNGAQLGVLRVVFNKPGTYYYNSQSKTEMRGQIIVKGNTNAPADFAVVINPDEAKFLVTGEDMDCS